MSDAGEPKRDFERMLDLDRSSLIKDFIDEMEGPMPPPRGRLFHRRIHSKALVFERAGATSRFLEFRNTRTVCTPFRGIVGCGLV